MKQELVKMLTLVLKDLGVTDVVPEVSIPENPTNGEYTTNVAMRLAGKEKGKRKTEKGNHTKPGSPMDIALQVKGILDKWKKSISRDGGHQSTYQRNQTSTENLPHNSAKDVLQDIARIEVAPPGFINFYLTEAKLGNELRSE